MIRHSDLVVDLAAHRDALKVSAQYAARRGDYDAAERYWDQVREADAALASGETHIVKF